MALKGRTPTVAEKEHMARVADVGCVVCRMKGLGRVPAEIHHIDGKTKKGSHFKVLPLCFDHHRRGSDKEPISRHPYKKRFVEAYGTEEELLKRVQTYMSYEYYDDFDDLPF
jgi:hypothetical protein